MRNISDRKGFTFLEVIVAVAIISIVFTAALKMVSQSLVLRSVSRFYSVAPYLASVAVEKLEKDGYRAGMSGDFGDEFSGWKWTANITKMSGSETYVWFEMLSRIDLTVRFVPDNLDYSIVLYKMAQNQ